MISIDEFCQPEESNFNHLDENEIFFIFWIKKHIVNPMKKLRLDRTENGWVVCRNTKFLLNVAHSVKQ